MLPSDWEDAIHLIVQGEAVPKQSYITRFGRPNLSERLKVWQDLIRWKAKERMAGNPPLDGPLELSITFLRKIHRRADWDNLSKGVCDSLNHVFWKDDSQIKRALVEVRETEKNPMVEIAVRLIPHA